MKIKSERDFWSGLMFLAIGIAFAWGATTYSFGSSARPGPGYFPFGLGILLAVLGASMVAAGVVDQAGRILERLQEPTPSRSPQAVEDAIVGVVDEVEIEKR